MSTAKSWDSSYEWKAVLTLSLAFIREPAASTAHAAGHAPTRAPMSQIFKHRNVPLAMVTLLCAMTGVFVLSAVMPNYLVDYLKLTGPQMGFVTSAIGFGGALGQFGLLTVSDFIGRRTATVVSFIVAAVFLWFFIHTGGANLPMLFGLLFVAAMFNFCALAILAGLLSLFLRETAPRRVSRGGSVSELDSVPERG